MLMGLQRTQLSGMACTHNIADNTNPVKVLGLWWDTHSDTICAAPNPDTTMYTYMATKREILKWSSSIFDPLGLITPVTITAKLFLQQLWQLQLKWDNLLTEELCKTWHKIATEVTQATAMPFPRQCTVMPDKPTLHIFADASPQAYRAIAYLVHETHSAILMSKARTAPLKQHTLPRLELMAAVLGARLYSQIAKLFFHGSLARKPSNPLSVTISMKSDQFLQNGDTVHQLTTRQTFSPEVRTYNL